MTRRAAIAVGAAATLVGAGAASASAHQGRPRFDVRDFGAVGDGVTDDTIAVNNALDAVEASGGGVLFFPPGTYPISGAAPAVLRDNLEIVGRDATILKAVRNGATFMALSRGRNGYGSGVRNVRIRGLRFLGSYRDTKLQCPFALHHASDVVIEDCVFEQVQGSRHSVDLNGCEDIVIRRCTWRGFYNNEGPGYVGAECIQIDYSYSGALSYSDSPGSHDGLLTRRVTVEDCEFLPLVADGVTYPCPNPLGIHGVKEDSWYEDIVFRGNLVLDPGEGPAEAWPEDPRRESVAYARGAVHLPTSRHVRIEGNTFRQTTGRVTRPISFAAASYVITTGSDPNVYPPIKTVLARPVGCDDVVIKDNVFEGFRPGTPDARPQEVIWLHGLPGGGEVRDVTIAGNTFRDLDSAAVTGAPAISTTHAQDVTITRNTCESASRFVQLTATTVGADVRHNDVRDARSVPGESATIDVAATDYSIMHNRLTATETRPAVGIRVGSGTDGKVMHNSIRGYTAAVVAPDPLPRGVVVKHNR